MTEKELSKELKYTGNLLKSFLIGLLIAVSVLCYFSIGLLVQETELKEVTKEKTQLEIKVLKTKLKDHDEGNSSK